MNWKSTSGVRGGGVWLQAGLAAILAAVASGVDGEPGRVDFNRDIRPLISNNCIACHGPDEEERKAKLRLDTPEGASADLGGYAALVPGKPDASELILRLTSDDEDEVMPPKGKGQRFTPDQVALVRRWIEQGGQYDTHWAYTKPVKVAPPAVKQADWPVNEIDRFLLARLEREGLKPTAEADRQTLARRVALDLTGLPPTRAEVEAFVRDKRPNAYETYVDAVLKKSSYGEHWAGIWLDLARYADSSGYPSDQPREIWGYRDWVIEALNRNLPFDQFTIEQIAGDLLPDPTEDQLIATAFHRNTMTQNEGGTSDEEFRVAAIIDRVNTTLGVWMGTTMACAQCHTHKFDPITQAEYFQVYAILNQSADADRKDEAPVHSFYTPDQQRRKKEIEAEVARLEASFAKPDPAVYSGLADWEGGLPVRGAWQTPKPSAAGSLGGAPIEMAQDGRVLVARSGGATDITTVELPVGPGAIEGLRLEALADERLPGKGPGHSGGNFVLSQVRADLVPEGAKPVAARRLRIELVSDRYDFLALAEVQAYSGFDNVAPKGEARQISTNPEGPEARLAIDGNTNGDSEKGKSVAVTGGGTEPQWWEVEFDADRPIDRVVVWKRTDKGQGLAIDHLRLTLFDAAGLEVWSESVKKKFEAREEITVSGRREIRLAKAFADATQEGFAAADVLAENPSKDKGWALSGFTGADRTLTLLPVKGAQVEKPSRLVVRLSQASKYANHNLGAFRLGYSTDSRVARLSGLPAAVLSALGIESGNRTEEQAAAIRDHYVREVAPELKSERAQLAAARKELAAIKPASVPIMQELAENERRKTQIQKRGNWQDLGDEVGPGVPAVFNPLPRDLPPNRLAMAKWLVSPDNPLTARVTVNRFWEALFGVGIVQSSEEFGSQGDLPFHPELLDWLAVDFMEHGWDQKRLLKQLVTTRAYRQDSRSTPELNELDPDNRFLARGPRFRPTGELLRDQALAVAAMLSPKVGGPAVRPVAPNLGLTTAFGRSNDWTTSEGEDRHRRSVYTEVRRNAPYASFSTFDAPNREVCTIRRGRTNTPLQAFVTLNDPAFVEANQGLARRLHAELPEGGVAARIDRAFEICLSRDPSDSELATVERLYREALETFQADADAALKMATEPIGPAPGGIEVAELAAWTVVANVMMNSDEFLMRR